MMKYTSTLALILLGLAFSAPTGLAYFSPEEVLLNKDYFLPPTAREGEQRLNDQQAESEARRKREQEIMFKQQASSQAAAPIVETEHPSAEGEGAASAIDLSTLSATDLQLLRTMRLLDRIDRNQNMLTYGTRTLGADGALHAGAPLAPTGAGGILAAAVMLGATGYTLFRAKRAGKWARV